MVEDNGNIVDPYKGPLVATTGVRSNITKWATLLEYQVTPQEHGVMGEVAAKVFFESKGFDILESNYMTRLAFLTDGDDHPDMYTTAACTSKKGPDNGIDGIFIPRGSNIETAPIIVINEAKFRGDKATLDSKDFGFVKKGNYAHNVQQSHSYWNRDRFNAIACVGDLKYASRVIIRTATLLKGDGILSLFEIQDQTGNTLNDGFPSEWHGNSDKSRAFKSLLS